MRSSTPTSGRPSALAASPHCLAYELSSCDEDPSQYVLRIEWDSRKGHLEGFRRSEHFRAFLPHIQPYIKAIAEMRHYTPRRVAGAGGGHGGADESSSRPRDGRSQRARE